MDLSDCSQILVFGGSFDPPHIGHVVLPMLAMEAMGADAVAYIPAGIPPHKVDLEQTPANHRLEMLRLAVAGLNFAKVLTLEIDRAAAASEHPPQPNYTVDTLAAVRERVGPKPTLRLLIGGDMLRSFDSWREPQRIVALAEPVVMVRPPDTVDSLLAALPDGFDCEEWRPRLVALPQLDVSSTLIRERCRLRLPIQGLTLASVESYIRRNKLYSQ